jgi:hypothetical protein
LDDDEEEKAFSSNDDEPEMFDNDMKGESFVQEKMEDEDDEDLEVINTSKSSDDEVLAPAPKAQAAVKRKLGPKVTPETIQKKRLHGLVDSDTEEDSPIKVSLKKINLGIIELKVAWQTCNIFLIFSFPQFYFQKKAPATKKKSKYAESDDDNSDSDFALN